MEIVTERSNDLTNSDTSVWNELQLLPDDGKTPRRAHAVVRRCTEHDHSSIIGEVQVGQLVCALLNCEDWSSLNKYDAKLAKVLKAHTA